MDALDLAIFALAMPLTIGVVQLLKEAFLPDRWAGLTAIAVGLLVGVMVRTAGIGDGGYGLAAITGAVAGLSAAGVWSGTKAATSK